MSVTISLTGNTSVLEADYHPPINLGSNAKCGLISIHTTNSIPNVDEHNNKFYFGTKIFTIRTGAYEIDALLEAIRFMLTSNLHRADLMLYTNKNLTSGSKFVILDKNDSSDVIRITSESLSPVPDNETIVINQNGEFIHQKLNIKITIPDGEYLASVVINHINDKVQERIHGIEEIRTKNNERKIQKRSATFPPMDFVDDADDYEESDDEDVKKLKTSFSKDDSEKEGEKQLTNINSESSPLESSSLTLNQPLDGIIVDQNKSTPEVSSETSSVDNSSKDTTIIITNDGGGSYKSKSISNNEGLGESVGEGVGEGGGEGEGDGGSGSGGPSNRISPFSHGKKLIIFNVNKESGKIMIYPREDIDFTKDSTIGPLLGFNRRVLRANQWHISDAMISISKLNSINVHCNIISGSYQNNSQAHIIHEFDLRAPTGFKISESPRHLIYLPVTISQLTSITVRITNQDGELIDLRGERISVRLHLITE